MRIGILTFWNSKSNYGQLFQGWALLEFLKDLGHEPYVIRYFASNCTPLKAFLKKSPCIKRIKISLDFFLKKDAYRKRRIGSINDEKRRFDVFREQQFVFSEKAYESLAEIKRNPPIADAYIAGSDQVWAQMLSNQNNRAYYLDFGDNNIKRIAYAPSFLVDEYPKEYRKELKSLLNRFDAISCREYSGVEICKSLGLYAAKVLDPTFLIDKKKYLNLIGTPIKKKKQIFVYSINILSPSQISWESLTTYADINKLSVKVTPAQGYFPSTEIFGEDVDYSYLTPVDWLKTIAESQFVVTTSFHGVALSIILEIPFVYVPLSGSYENGNSRVIDLLKDIGLADRIFWKNQEYKTIFSNIIDWSEVENRLSVDRISSIEYLKRSL